MGPISLITPPLLPSRSYQLWWIINYLSGVSGNPIWAPQIIRNTTRKAWIFLVFKWLQSSHGGPNLSCIPSCPFVWLIHAKGTQITHLRPLEPLQCIQNNKKSFKSCALNPVNRCLLIGLLIHWPLGLLACWTKGQLVVGLLVHWPVVLLFCLSITTIFLCFAVFILEETFYPAQLHAVDVASICFTHPNTPYVYQLCDCGICQ